MNELLASNKTQELLKDTIKYYGIGNQCQKAIEELSELIRALSRVHYSSEPSVIENFNEEMADVYIMLEQLKLIFRNQEDVKKQLERKLERLTKRINKEV